MKKRSLFIIPMTLMLFSCEQMEAQKKKKDDTISTKRSVTESDKEYAAKLTRVGEILVNNPVGALHANDLFDQALKLDPSNDKALFYSAFTGIYETLRGIGTRAKPISDTPSEYDEAVKNINEYYKYPEFKDFITSGKNLSLIKTYQDAKRFLQVELDGALENAVKKLNNIDQPIDIILTNLQTENSTSVTNCRTEEDVDGSYTTCDFNEKMNAINAIPGTHRNVDLTDVKVIASGLKAHSVYLKLYTAYSIEGAKNLMNEVKVKESDLGRTLTDEESHTIIKRYPDFLRLESDHKLNKIVADLESIVEMGMDLDTLNNQFCGNDLRSNNLIQAICIGDAERKSMKEALSYLSGPKEITLGLNENGEEVKIIMDLPTYLGNPLQDLKSLVSGLTYDEEGNGQVTEEPQLNGLFPNNDLLEKTGQVVQ